MTTETKKMIQFTDVIVSIRKLKALKDLEKWEVKPDPITPKRKVPNIYNLWEQMSSTTRK